ncbi:MAG: acetylornithine transaminase [Clostridia bacterium]|nr:acetylornithine transaminase [Clostridia bacterium]
MLKENDKKYIASTYARYDVEIAYGKGSLMYGYDGREFIDLTSGIGVNVFGTADPEWLEAVTSQLSKVAHTSNLYYTAPDGELARLLCEKTGMSKAFFCNSGAEANECAIKAARKYSAQTKGEEFYNIITFESSFHGRTLTTLAATGQEKFHKLFRPLTPGFFNVKNTDEIDDLVKNEKIAGIMLEVVQGEGGVNVMPEQLLSAVSELCEKNDIPLIIDEVQTGNGRTGTLYSYMRFGLKPDVFTTAKGLGGGLPIGACVLSEKLESIFAPGDNGSTFGGNPAVCAGAVSIIKRLTPAFLEDVDRKGRLLKDFFAGKKGVKSVTGLGLMIGVEPEGKAADIVKQSINDGVLALTAGGNKVRLLPPLNTPDELLLKGAEIIVRNMASA